MEVGLENGEWTVLAGLEIEGSWRTGLLKENRCCSWKKIEAAFERLKAGENNPSIRNVKAGQN